MQPIEWTTLEYEDRERTPDWFWAVGIITVAIALSSILLGNVLFAIFIIIAGFALTLQVIKKPQMVTVQINESGVKIHNILYIYSALDAFWIEDFEGDQKLILKSKKILVPYVVIPIQNTNLETIREYLSKHLEEEEMHEPLAQKIMEYLGF